MTSEFDVSEIVTLAGGKGPGETLRARPHETDPDAALTIASRNVVDSHTGLSRTLMTISLPGTNNADHVHLNLRPCDDEFALKSIIGKGGQGEVWEATQVDLGRSVAIKRSTAVGEEQADFMKEAFTTAQLDHPNIVPVYTLGMMWSQEGTAPVLSMKRIVGDPWRRVLLDDRRVEAFDLDAFLRRHLQIMVQVINAVAYAHSKKIIHRDLKPAQVMIGEFGEVFLLDWGLAIYLEDALTHGAAAGSPVDSRRVYTLETATNPAGSPAYMAPEQADFSSMGLGIHTDIYLLGGMLYEILTGYPPHHADTVADAVKLARANFYEPIEDEAPPELAALAERCMATNPSVRPASVVEIRRHIEDYLANAGRKQESRARVRLVGDPEMLSDYAALSAVTRTLSQAEHLWPGNPDVPPLRERLLQRFATCAIAERDFILAQLQVGRLQDHEAAAELRRSLDAAREAAAGELPRAPLLTVPRMAALLASYLIVAVAVLAIVQSARETVVSEVKNKVASLASLAAREISSTDVHAAVANPSIRIPQFLRIINVLSYHRASNRDIRFIYVYRPEFDTRQQTNWRVVVDVDPLSVDINGNGHIDDEEEGNMPGDLYEDGNEAMAQAFLQRTTTSSYLKDDWGEFISGFAPIYDDVTGEPVAELGVDINFARVSQKLVTVKWAALGGGAVLAVLLTGAFFLFFQSRRAIAQIQLLEDEIRKQNMQLSGKDIYLG